MDSKLLLELVGLFLTLMVLLYMIIGDNALFRIVTYTFVGVAAGYVAILVLFQVLVPRFFILLRTGNLTYLGLGLIPFLLGLLLFFKLSPRLSPIGTLPMAILVGVGAAVLVGGALFGTLFGQVSGTAVLFHPAAASEDTSGYLFRLGEGVYVLIGAITTLAYFQFSTRSRATVIPEGGEAIARRAFSLEALAKIGQVFIGITLGAVFAGVFTAAVTALVERIGFVINVITDLVTKFS